MKKKWEAQESLPIEELREITNEEREYEAVIKRSYLPWVIPSR